MGVARRSAHAIEQTGRIRLGLAAAEQQSPQVMQVLRDVPASLQGIGDGVQTEEGADDAVGAGGRWPIGSEFTVTGGFFE
ncbi:hypothetical protein AB0D83_30910 [Streptomyces decoyicus]